MRQRRFSLIAALLLAVPLAAQESRVYREGTNWVQETTGSLGTANSLLVKVDMGSVRVEGGARSGIDYVIRNRSNASSQEDARRQFDAYKFSAAVRGDTASIEADWRGGRRQKFSSEFVIRVPREIESVKVETAGGSIATTGISGSVDVKSGGGSVHVDDVTGDIHAETGGGGISVGNVGGDVSLRTGGGSIQLSSAKGKISAETGGGNMVLVSGMQGAELETGGGGIKVDHCSGRVKVSTGGGSIDLGDIAGAAVIQTGGGSIRLASAQGPVRAETGGGAIELNGVPSAFAQTGSGGIVAKFRTGGERTDSMLRTGAGDITVYLPANLAITVQASIEAADGHKIYSDFPEIQIKAEGGQWGSKLVTADGTLNGGGPDLKVRTATGDIRFRREN